MTTKADLYGLCLDKNKSCFITFDPSDYTEVRGYQNNPVFKIEGATALLDDANTALAYFTRADSYDSEIRKRYGFHNAKIQAKSEKTGVPIVHGFTVTMFQAFKRERSDFEEAVLFCCDHLRQLIDQDEWILPHPLGERLGWNDAHILFRILRPDDFNKKSDNTYKDAHLLSAFALWKIDRALLAIQNHMAADTANLLVDARKALKLVQDIYELEIRKLLIEKGKKEAQASGGNKRHKEQDALKQRSEEIYNSKKEWKSRASAAGVIYHQLINEFDPCPLSEGEGPKTIAGWIKKFDPENKRLKNKRGG